MLYSSARTIEEAHRNIQSDLSKLSNWCRLNRLTLNASKTKSMIFGTKRFTGSRTPPPLYAEQDEIRYTVCYKYLGVTLDNNLNFQSHVNQVHKLAAHKIFILSKIRPYITVNAAIRVYKTKILPYFDQGDLFYMGSHLKSTDKLQKLQNRALRICLNSGPRNSRNTLHVQAEIPLLEFRRISHLRNYMYKRKENPVYIENAQVNTRRHDAVMVKSVQANYTLVERSIFCKGAKEWNNLDLNQRNIPTFERFKAFQKRWLKSTIHSA